jgi:hypothetical protein
MLDAPQFPRQQFTITQLRPRTALGFGWCSAACEQLRIVVIKMLREFLDNGCLARRF